MEKLNKEFMGRNTYDGITRSDSPLLFLRKNVLIIEDLLEGGFPRATWEGDFDLIYQHKLRHRGGQRHKVRDHNQRDTGGKVVYMGRLRDRAARVGHDRSAPGKHTHGIPAYFLGWQQGRCFSRQIGNAYNLFLTPQLTGCTFVAVGTNRGTMTVAHFNGRMSVEIRKACVANGWAHPEPLYANEGDINRQITAWNWHTRPYRHAFRPAHYPRENDVATIIGCRIRGAWQFYYQINEVISPRQYEIREVGSLPTL